MEKILLILDAVKPSFKAVDFACYIANLTHSKLTGVFLENALAATASGEFLRGVQFNEIFESEFDEEYKKKCFEANIYSFNAACEKRGVIHSVHRDRGIPVKEVIEESRFADLMIVEACTSFVRRYEGAPTSFTKAVLEKTECPVIITPENFEGIGKIIFTYDGSKSSVFAIKQFAYLFPQFTNMEATILQVNKETGITVREKYKLREWLKAHYCNIDIQILHGDPRYELIDYLVNKKDVLLVMGAYGGNILSHFFHTSNAELVIKTINAPVFIAHY
jgi:nucleotide-binding universal stress UspA family protein